MARVQIDSYFSGYIDKTGKLVIPCIHDRAYDFSNDMARVREQGKNGRYGYINKTGELVIPYQYDYAFDFSDGLAYVINCDDDFTVAEHRYIDKNGNAVFTHKSKVGDPYYGWPYDYSFHNGLAVFMKDDKFVVLEIERG